MAMINCPECGKEISDKAATCPNCGCPIGNPTPMRQNVQTFACVKCKNQIPVNSPRCPICGYMYMSSMAGRTDGPVVVNAAPKKKKGSKGKTALIIFGVIFALGIIGSALGNEESERETERTEESQEEEATIDAAENATTSDTDDEGTENSKDTINSEKEEQESESEIAYIVVTATELSDDLSNNAMKAQNDYIDQYLEITGKIGNIDSNGKYIGIDSDKDFDFTIIQCYLKTDEQKEIIMEMSKGDSITIRGYCKDIGEILGYQIDVEEIIK